MASYAGLERIVRAFHARGVRMLIGTDAMNTGVVPGFSAHDELQDLVTAGLTPFEALRAATTNAADFLGGQHGAGTVAVGKVADLVLLEGNPLESIANSRLIAGVVLRGRWLSAAQIRDMLADLASSP